MANAVELDYAEENWTDVDVMKLVQLLPSATRLRSLSLGLNPAITTIPKGVSAAQALESLSLKGLKNLQSLSADLGELRHLEQLDLTRCSRLKILPDGLGPSLRRLEIVGCSSLRLLPVSLGRAKALEHLDARGCSSLVELPPNMLGCLSLARLQCLLNREAEAQLCGDVDRLVVDCYPRRLVQHT